MIALHLVCVIFLCQIVTLISLLLKDGMPFVPSLKNVPYRMKDIIPKQQIESVRLRHIQVETEEMAKECYRLLMDGSTKFENLAALVSVCSLSKDKGGELGWFHSNDNFSNLEYPSFFSDLAMQSLEYSKGEIVITPVRHLSNSEELTITKSWHLLQITDIMTKLSPKLISRKKELFRASKLSFEQNAASSKYFIETLGCQMNQADSERIAAQLTQLGLEKAEKKEEADTIIVNTCSIRDHAEQKVYSFVGPHAQRKKKGENINIIIAGCVAQQEGEQLIQKFPEIDGVIGPQYANRFGDLMQSIADGYQIVATDPAHQNEDDLLPIRNSEFSAFVNVIYGCNERCTYCVVPNTRGVEQSRTLESIVEEIESLVATGYQEVTLLGQNIDAWGRDFTPKQKFADLLNTVGKIPGLRRLRFLTSHPRYMTERVIRAVAKNSAIMPCFNIPFQSGDNDILQMMRRGYTRERYLEIVKNIRELLPDAAITADCIVGFPGETEEQFQKTLDLMHQVKFDMLNTKSYSPRPGTPAAIWSNQIPDDIKDDRLKRINILAGEHAYERSLRYLGRIESVLVEDINIKNPLQVYGRNPQTRLVYFPGNIHELKGKIVQVKITAVKPYYLMGEIVDQNGSV